MTPDPDDRPDAPSPAVGAAPARRWRVWALAWLAAMALAAAGGWLASGWLGGDGGVAEAPLILPDGPAKRAPDDPGGQEIPHQDRQVYNLIGDNVPPGTVERLLPPPGAPGDVAKEEVAEAPLAPPPPVKPVPPAVNKPGPAKPAASPEKATPPPAPPAKGAWRVQLLSVGAAADAHAAWTRLQAKHGALLGGLSASVESATVNGRATHRLRVGPLADRAAANALCDALGAVGQACLPIAPGR